MWTKFVLLALVISADIILNIQAEGTSCEANNILYKEIGCLPKNVDKDGCPQEYDCSHLEHQDSSKCRYNGKLYALGDRLIEEETEDLCLADCFCSGHSFTGSKFVCAHLECLSLFGMHPKEPCYLRYETYKCCGIEYCPKPDEQVHTCSYEGYVVKEGQVLYVGNKKCLCSATFNGTLDSIECRDVRCGYELLYSERLHDYSCAPVFYDSKDGCPISWRCYSSEGEVVPQSKDAKSSDVKCKYGKALLAVGQKLTEKDDVTCTCEVPPLVTCVKKPTVQQSIVTELIDQMP